MGLGKGLLKKLCDKFSCKSNCTFNPDDCDKDLLDMDLRQYKLKDEDLRVLQKIRTHRPSKHNYTHTNKKAYSTI